MNIRRAALAAAIVAATSSHAFAQQKTVTADLAVIMVQEAVQKCRADGLKITAKVVDASKIE